MISLSLKCALRARALRHSRQHPTSPPGIPGALSPADVCYITAHTGQGGMVAQNPMPPVQPRALGPFVAYVVIVSASAWVHDADPRVPVCDVASPLPPSDRLALDPTTASWQVGNENSNSPRAGAGEGSHLPLPGSSRMGPSLKRRPHTQPGGD